MKVKSILILAIAILGINSLFAQCDSYYPMNPSDKFEVTTYDKKGKTVTVTQYEIEDTESKSDGSLVATVSAKVLDDDGKEIGFHNFPVTCKDGTVSLQMDFRNNPAFANMGEGMDVEVDGEGYDLPSNLSPGMELEDAVMKVSLRNNGMSLMTMTLKQTDRKVEAAEKITTSAGTFDCMKITYTGQMKMLMTKKTTHVEWVAKGIGMVKSETYNKRGKLIASSELTAFTPAE